ncbi:hypothetical protein [Mesorhizobium onobrychidis]|uniref:Uncharacterized protein n=1 Tax=Mesorhizobium onobrychidis TaxID=2775404 RepID=A0ABY5QR45_9HYPH|nr:hypothetical protein [Mesorhizobium onobrychidis]UVC13655.1 hypothetical protein IHQ72_23470 [Mesorhizobium onobrychidis]
MAVEPNPAFQATLPGTGAPVVLNEEISTAWTASAIALALAAFAIWRPSLPALTAAAAANMVAVYYFWPA